jgi:cell division protein FtsB
MWEQFIARCQSKGTTATATLTQFIELYLDDDCDNLDSIAGNENKRLDSLEQKVEEITAQMARLTEAIIKIQDYLNKQPRRQNKSYNNNSYYQGQTPRIQPITEENLAKRLNVSVETIREQRVNLPPPLFVAWCKGKDKSGIGWEFNENTLSYHPVS